MDPFGAAGGVRFEIETDRCAWAGPCRSWLPGVRDQPGLGTVLGARILGEFGDEPHRYTDAKAGRDCAGTSRSPARPAAEEVVLARYASQPSPRRCECHQRDVAVRG